jgi:CheY-like chemotaxis protein
VRPVGTANAARVLCVEDDPDIARVLQLMVEAVPGHRALLAENGERALAILGGDSLQLAFIDLGLPDIDGVDLVREIRRRYPELDIVVVTAYHERRGEAIRAGATAFVGKPFDPEHIVKLVEQHAGRADAD